MGGTVSRSRLGALTASLLAVSINCGSRESPPPPPPPPVEAPTPAPAPSPDSPGPVQIEMKDVRLHVDDGIVLDVRSLRGEMVSTVRGQPPVFDDPRSYILHLATADIVADTGSLATLMNRHVFGYDDAPLKDLEISVDEGRLKQTGKMKKGVWLPFSTKATVFATPDGRLGLHTESVKALHLPATKLLDLFGLSLEDLVGLEKRRGVEIQGRRRDPRAGPRAAAAGDARPPGARGDRGQRPAPRVRHARRPRAGGAHAARSEGETLRVLLRIDHPFRQADDDRRRPAAHRRRRARSCSTSSRPTTTRSSSPATRRTRRRRGSRPTCRTTTDLKGDDRVPRA